MKNKFFEITFSEGKKAYIPSNQLVRIEAIPDKEQGMVVVKFLDYPITVDTTHGAEQRVADKLYENLNADEPDPIVLNPQTPDVTGIYF